MIKAVIIGFSHMHVNEMALYISQCPGFQLAAAAEVPSPLEPVPPLRYTPGWNREHVREHYCSNIYSDYVTMLDTEKPDMAFILSENCQKPAIVEQCARRGVHVCIEKPIAVSLSEARNIEKSVKRYGIEAVVNWPVLWRSYIHKMAHAVEARLVGRPLELRYLNGHTGPLGKGAKHRGVSDRAEEMTDEMRGKTWWHHAERGGGVFLDLSCYGCLFAKWFLGSGEKSALAYGTNLNTPFGNTEDNFAAMIKYDGKMAVIEGTWTTPRAVIPSGPMLVCSDGVLVCTGGAEQAPDVKAYDMYGNEVEIPDLDLPVAYQNMPEHYLNHVETGEPIHPMLTLSRNMEIMAMMEAVMNSAKTGKEERILE